MESVIIIILFLFVIFLVIYLFLYIKKSKKRNGFETIKDGSELDDIFLFDFLNYQSGNTLTNIPILQRGEPLPDNPTINNIPVGKIAVKPIDVLNELETIPTPFSLAGIDNKIEILKTKASFIKLHYSRKEVEGLIERLENRKKYDLCKPYFDSFQNTNDDKINSLLEKYDLVIKSADLFIPEFPDDAIHIMEKYKNEVGKICSKSPVFYVIATSENFESSDKKRDPILLVQSPFGFYWQILGAWDKEMLILSEL